MSRFGLHPSLQKDLFLLRGVCFQLPAHLQQLCSVSCQEPIEVNTHLGSGPLKHELFLELDSSLKSLGTEVDRLLWTKHIALFNVMCSFLFSMHQSLKKKKLGREIRSLECLQLLQSMLQYAPSDSRPMHFNYFLSPSPNSQSLMDIKIPISPI